jgi:hypothetical protein
MKVFVGEEPHQKTFTIHEGIICARSKFFRCAMKGYWVEREDRLVKLPKEDAGIFEMYLNLVYANKITSKSDSIDSQPTVEEIHAEYYLLVKLYVLCEMLQDTVAKNPIVEAILAVSQVHVGNRFTVLPASSVVAEIYSSTLKDNPARRLMVDLWSTIDRSLVTETQQSGPPYEFLIDLAMALRDMLSEHGFDPMSMSGMLIRTLEMKRTGRRYHELSPRLTNGFGAFPATDLHRYHTSSYKFVQVRTLICQAGGTVTLDRVWGIMDWYMRMLKESIDQVNDRKFWQILYVTLFVGGINTGILKWYIPVLSPKPGVRMISQLKCWLILSIKAVTFFFKSIFLIHGNPVSSISRQGV